MKILLISTNTMTDPYPTYPIGLDYVANAIAPSHDVVIADLNTLDGENAVVEVLTGDQFDLIGLSIRNIDTTDLTHVKGFAENMEDIIRLIRRHSKAKVVLGGSGFTILPDEWMRCLDADFGIIGEGERLPLLLDALEKNEPPAGLPGIVSKGDIAVFPEPWYGPFPRGPFLNRSYTVFYLQRGGMLNLQTKRGCPFQCIYCTYPHIEGKTFRFVPPAEVARTARMLQDAGARYLYITDSTFNGDYEHSRAVALAFKKAGITVPWGAFFTPTRPPEDYYRTLADCGLKHVEFGTEALNDSMLRVYRKPFKIEDIRTAHQLAVEAGLYIAHYFMIGGPGESEETLKETLNNTSDLEKAVYFAFCGIRIYPHTDLYDLALQERQICTTTDLLKPVFYWSSMLNRKKAMDLILDYTKGRSNWLVGAGVEKTSRVIARLYARGHIGPLWEYMIR
ncbi:MAG: radical SAM protein [Syntrophaceae bacterium]|nr:radical SAM protein [Syntrophaceae bacterium]